MKNNNSLYQIKYIFVPMGSAASRDHSDPNLQIKKNRVFLDVGNMAEPGIIDHHCVQTDSNVELLYRHPQWVLDNLDLAMESEISIVLHRQPDLDCIASAYLTVYLIENGNWPSGVQALVDYVNAADSGRLSLDRENIITLATLVYAIHEIVELRTEREGYEGLLEKNIAILNRGFEILDYIMGRLSSGQFESLHDSRVFSGDHPFKAEEVLIYQDYDKYLHDLDNNDPDGEPVCEKKCFELPNIAGDFSKVQGLIWNSPPKCLFHKLWARSDLNAPGKQGYILTFIPIPVQSWYTSTIIQDIELSRVIISVNPNCGVNLADLGAALEKAEQAKQRALFKDDFDSWRSRDLNKVRPGYDIEDPWYDGRAHGYTIVDSPARGSLLTVTEIKEVLMKLYGCR